MDPSETISPSTPYLNYSTRRNLSPPPPPPPPSAKAEDNELLIEHVNSNVHSLLNKYPDALIVLTGDFNPNSTNISLSTLARGCGLTQLVKVPTRGNNILDWCLGEINPNSSTNQCNSQILVVATTFRYLLTQVPQIRPI